ncbi:MAG: riboflavin synthase [Chloroflexi bacterium]|jgi:riboflavin synthase|nr:riboflavin synthase [Chloroflexota bacterium]
MFTGIIEEIGKVYSQDDYEITIECKKILDNSKLGDSISTSGICLTITKIDGNNITFDLSEETINKTIFGKEQNITHVNLERSATLETRIGGHLVEGHVEDTGICREIKELNESTVVTFEVNQKIIDNIIEKGYIAIDGTSLTVNEIKDNLFKVSFIPHTLRETTFKNLKINQYVNVETDVNARYIKKYVEDIIKRNNK